MREELMAVREEIKDLKRQTNEQSLAWEMLHDSKRANVRIAMAFASVLIVVSIFWFLTLAYLIHTLNDIGSTTEASTQEIRDIDTINGNVLNQGDIYGENKANYNKKN